MAGRKKGTWKCRNCEAWNPPGGDECLSCGRAKPTGPRGRKPSTVTQAPDNNKAERASGLTSQQHRDGEKGRKARGKALANSPLALDIEARVRRAAQERRERENEEAEARGEEPWERGYGI